MKTLLARFTVKGSKIDQFDRHTWEEAMRKPKVSLEVKYQAFLKMARKLTKEELSLKDKNDTRLFFGLPPLPETM
jgi:hypothetical protein